LGTILEDISAGDQSAVARCLDEYGGLVWSLAGRYLRTDRSHVEDAVQEVFVSVWTSAGRFDPTKGSEAAFVATIARRRLIDYRRRLMTDKSHPSDTLDAGAAPEPGTGTGSGASSGSEADEMARLGKDFGELPEEERTALYLALSRGLSHSEIARATRSPIGTVKTRLRRAVLRLQEMWGVGAADARPMEELA